MSIALDFGPIYTSTGAITQIEYASKCADLGSTIVAIKSSKGIVIAVEKPRESKLIANTMNKRARRMCQGTFMTYSGLLSDGLYIFNSVKNDVLRHLETFEETPSPNILKGFVSQVVSVFTRYFSARPVGCQFVTGSFYNGKYRLLVTDCYSKTNFVKAFSVGKGASRANSELEKLEFTDATIEQMADDAVRILYKSYDPLRDPLFDIELVHLDETSQYNVAEFDSNFLASLVEKYQYYSVDGE